MNAVTLPRLVAATLALVAVLFALGWLTREDPSNKPYLTILGGGFVANYRIAEMHYGFTAAVTRPLPTGSVIEVLFENPSGGPPLATRQRVGSDTDRYTFHSPPVTGVEAGRRYAIDIHVYEREGDRELWRDRIAYASQVSSGTMPDRPLTVGPGYARNPAPD
jgi:hypothetical protein